MVTLIDYGGSNLRSVHKALEAVGAQVRVATRAAEVAQARKLILPGVGAFGAGMNALIERDLDGPIWRQVARGVPVLGICLGMQLLFERSEEMGQHDGLGLIKGDVRRFPDDGPKIPHMGWNQIVPNETPLETQQLLRGVPSGAYAYFVHSYYCQPANPAATIAYADYGQPFTAMVAKDNVYGIQFHPEKSQRIGLTILRNFIEMER